MIHRGFTRGRPALFLAVAVALLVVATPATWAWASVEEVAVAAVIDARAMKAEMLDPAQLAMDRVSGCAVSIDVPAPEPATFKNTENLGLERFSGNAFLTVATGSAGQYGLIGGNYTGSRFTNSGNLDHRLGGARRQHHQRHPRQLRDLDLLHQGQYPCQRGGPVSATGRDSATSGELQALGRRRAVACDSSAKPQKLNSRKEPTPP